MNDDGQGMKPVLVAQVQFLNATGLSQQEVAERLGVSQQTVSRYLAFVKKVCAPLVSIR